VVGNLIWILLEIYCSLQQWKNFANRSRIDKVMAMDRVAPFFDSQCSVQVYGYTRAHPWYLSKRLKMSLLVTTAYYPRQGGYVFVVVCLFVCLSVGLFVCLLATSRKNFRTDLHEIFGEGLQWANEQTTKFWWRSGSPSEYRRIVFRIRLCWEIRKVVNGRADLEPIRQMSGLISRHW